MEGIFLNKVATAQNIKNRENNFLGDTYKDDSCQISDIYDDVGKVETFCVIPQEKGFFPLKREFEGF